MTDLQRLLADCGIEGAAADLFEQRLSTLMLTQRFIQTDNTRTEQEKNAKDPNMFISVANEFKQYRRE